MSDLTLNKKQAQKMDMGQAEILLNKVQKKNADNNMAQMEREQFFTTYKKDQQEAFQKESIFGKYNKLDSDVFPAVLNKIKSDREIYADSDLDLKTYAKQEIALLSDTLEAVDLKQKTTKYKNVYGYENIAGFNFKDTILTKELLQSLQQIDLTDIKNLNDARKKITEAITQCDTIKNKALQHVSNENFKSTQPEKEIAEEDAKINLLGNLFDDKIFNLDCKDKDISSIRKSIFHGDLVDILKKEKERQEARYKSNKPDPHVVNYKKDNKVFQYTFEQNLQTIIKNCQIGENELPRDFKNAKDLRAFVDEMTVSIAQLIASFCAAKYNIDRESEGYRQLLIGLVAQNQFYQANKKDRVDTLKLSELGVSVSNQMGIGIDSISFSELFDDKEKLLNRLVRARDFSADVLAIEENRDYKKAGKSQGTELMYKLSAMKNLINDTEINSYCYFAKEIDRLDTNIQTTDPIIQRNQNRFNEIKAEILKNDPQKSQEYNNVKSSDIKISKLLDADKLQDALKSKAELVNDDSQQFNLLSRDEIKKIGKELSDILDEANALMEKGRYDDLLGTFNNYKGLYNVISKSADVMNDLVSESLAEISLEKGTKVKVQFNIDNKKIEELISTKSALWAKIYDMVDAAIEFYKDSDPIIAELSKKGIHFSIDDVMDNQCKDKYVIAVRKCLSKRKIWAAYTLAFQGISKCQDTITEYRKSLENIIDKKSDVSDYYDGVSLVRDKLVKLRSSISSSQLDKDEIEDYKKAEEFKQRFKELREKQIVESKNLKNEKVAVSKEEAKINQGKEIYNLLKEFDSFKTHIAENKELASTYAGRKIIDDVMKIQQEQSDRLIAEKKEELAYYEGNLLKMEINDFQKKNKSFGQNMKGNAANKRVEFVAEYMPLKEKMTAYLERYAELKNSTYYVKQIAVVQEAVDRQLKAVATDKLLDIYDKAMASQEVQDKQLKFDYSTAANLSKTYKSFVAKLRGMDKFGDFKDDVKLSNKADKLLKMDISEEELKGGLDCIFSLSVVSERMMIGDMNITNIMRNMSFPGNITHDLIEEDLLKKVRQDKKLQAIAKEWFKEKCDKLRTIWATVVNSAEREAIYELGSDRSYNEQDEMAFALGRYIAAQSPVALQLESLADVGFAIGVKEISEGKEKIALEDLRADIKKYRNEGKKYGLTSYDSEIHQADALKAYRELKINNNVTTVLENAKKNCKEHRDEVLEGIEHKTITAQLENFEVVRQRRDKPSKYFTAVDDAMQKVAAFEAIDYSTVSNEELEKKLADHKAAFTALIEATSEYIRTRDTWNHAFTKDGQARLDAIREVHKVALANLNYFETNSKYIVDEHTKLDNDRVRALQTKLENFKKNPPQGNQLENFNELFAREIKYDGSERLFNSTEGIEFYVQLNQEQQRVKKAVVREIISNVEKIKYDCAKYDVTASKKIQFAAWARCYNYYNKFEKNCPDEAKEALQSLRTLSREYFNAKEAETILQEIKKREVSDAIAKYAKEYTVENQYTAAEYADMMRLSHKYSTFIAGVAVVYGNTKEISFIPGYDTFVAKFNTMKARAKEYYKNDDHKEAVIQESKKQLDQKLQEVRGQISKSTYITGDINTEVAQQIKDVLEQIAYFFSLYSSKNQTTSAFVEYYGAQRNNLQDILSANPTRMLLTEDYGLSFNTANEAKTGYIAASDKLMPVDQRMTLYRKAINKNSKNADALDEKKIPIRAESINQTIKYIVSVETEKNQLGGVANVNKTSPEMANVLERQLAVRADFETRLKNRDQNKNKEDQKIRDEALKAALADAAGDYFKLLSAKEISISNKNLPTEQERLMYYFVSFSKNFDEANAFLNIARTWKSQYGLDITSSNLSKLEDIISRINFKTKETLQYNNLTQADQDIKAKINHMKHEAVLAQYSTEDVCKRRDDDFVLSMQNLGDLKLNSVKSFRENDFVKNTRRFNGADNYKNLKVEKSWNLTIFGFTFWGKVDHSINDYAKRLLHYSKKYPELIQPMKTLLELKGYAQAAIAETDKLTREESLNYFNRCIQSINKDIIIATSKASGNNFQSDQRRIIHMSDSDIKSVRQGWMEFYGILKELKLQLNDYMERHPIDETKDVNANAKVNHVRFQEAMAEMNSGDTTLEAMEKKLFKILQYSNENKYAESAFEHSANVEYSMYKNFLTSWFENHCFEQAEQTLKAITMDVSQPAVLDHYMSFIKVIEKYDASHAISKETYKYLKNRVLEACKAKYSDFKDLEVEARAQMRAQVIYENVLSFLNAGNRIEFIPEATSADLQQAKTEDELKLLKIDFNKVNVETAHYIKSVAYQAAMLEARNTKLEAANEASEKALADSVIFLDKATEVLKKEGGWWFVLKDFVAYAVGNAQAAWFKAKEA